MYKVGLTTTVPSEILYAAGAAAVDLNNLFITSKDPLSLCDFAERKGLPSTLCSWIKGIYSVAVLSPDIKDIVVVTEGDCSNARPLSELLEREGKRVSFFSYPFERDKDKLNLELSSFASGFGVTLEDAWKKTRELDRIREKVAFIDYLTWEEGKVTGFENHFFLIGASDFEGNPAEYEKKIDNFILQAEKRERRNDFLRIGIVGVPPIFSDLYDYLETKSARVVYNETQRQFSLPDRSGDFADRYLNYSYPYSFSFRFKDISERIKERRLDGIIHYVQSFCHHQMEHRMLKEQAGIPVLLLEGDRPGQLDERLKIRLESFIEMIG